MDREILAIDIGASSIKAIAGIAENDSLTIIASAIIATQGYNKGVFTDYNAVAESVREAIDCINSVRCVQANPVIGIGGASLSFINGRGCVAPASPEQINSGDIKRVHQAAILSQVHDEEQVLHVIANSYWIDGRDEEPLGKQGNQLEVAAHIVTYPKEQLKALTDALIEKKINPEMFVSSAITASQKILASKQQANFLMLDIGAGTVDAVIYNNGQIIHSCSLPLGGQYITQDIMQGLHVTYLHAEEIKRYYTRLDPDLRGRDVMLDCNDFGTDDKNISYDFLSNIVESRIEEIIAIVYEYLGGLCQENRIESVIVTGGCACMSTLRKSIEGKFAVPVELYQPDVAEYMNPAYAACFGILSHVAKRPVTTENKERASKPGILSLIKKMF